MNGEPVRHGAYVAYMLRLWRAGSRAGRPVWRASLENPHTGERLAFGDMDALFAFLTDLTALRAEVAANLKANKSDDPDEPDEPGDSANGFSSRRLQT